MKVVRDKEEKTLNVRVGELDLDAEQAALTSRGGRGNDTPQQEASSGFGMSLSNITPDVARRLRLDDNTKGAVVVDVEPGEPGRARRHHAGRRDHRASAARRSPAWRMRAASWPVSRQAAPRSSAVMRSGQDTAVVVTKE